MNITHLIFYKSGKFLVWYILFGNKLFSFEILTLKKSQADQVYFHFYKCSLLPSFILINQAELEIDFKFVN